MTRHVSPQIRAVIAAIGGFAIWQFMWTAEEADRLAKVLPEPWTVTSWLTAWATVAVVAAIAAVCGKDLPTRITLGLLVVVEVMGVTVAIAADPPIGLHFWAVGQALLVIAVCACLLVSPLRSVPKGPIHGSE